MAKEETKPTLELKDVEPEVLDAKKLAAYADQLENRLKIALQSLREAKKELEVYQMQDYYQRAQLLLTILSSQCVAEEFQKRCHDELLNMVFPPVKEPEAKE